MAVTFAVGAVTGTVLSFEFGLLWPRFMGRWGDVFGVPFAFEGIFFFTEAIFVSIYIFGWRRLKTITPSVTMDRARGPRVVDEGRGAENTNRPSRLFPRLGLSCRVCSRGPRGPRRIG